MHQAIGWTVAGVEIGNWIVILIQAQVVAVQAEVNIETSVAIVVGNSRMRKRSLRRVRKFEGIALNRERSVPFI